jgi:nudix-type nucleoside diphosphatase (YffH/AdpP family)
MSKIKILSEKKVYEDYLKIVQSRILDKNKGEIIYERNKVDHSDGVAILVYNKDIEKFILVNQYRYPINDYFTEVVAGKIDNNEDPIESAKREVQEEIGYTVLDENIKYFGKFAVTPGYSTEFVNIFIAVVSNNDKTSEGGGLDIESENITLLYLGKEELEFSLYNGIITDAKTLMAYHFYKQF